MVLEHLPKISIITASLNANATIEGTIQSVLKQEYPSLEYIIVDGGSTDGTLGVVQKYSTAISRWVSEPDWGISDAFNKGIGMATGEIIGIISADDYLLPGALNFVAQVFVDNPGVDVIYGNVVMVEANNQKRFAVKPDVGLRTVWRRQPLKHAATFVSRSAYERMGNFDLQYRFAMDYELILRFYIKKARFIYVDEELTAYRTGGTNDRNLIKTITEVRDISLRYGYSHLEAYLIFWGKCVKLVIKQKIMQSGMVTLLNFYRSLSHRFSLYSDE